MKIQLSLICISLFLFASCSSKRYILRTVPQEYTLTDVSSKNPVVHEKMIPNDFQIEKDEIHLVEKRNEKNQSFNEVASVTRKSISIVCNEFKRTIEKNISIKRNIASKKNHYTKVTSKTKNGPAGIVGGVLIAALGLICVIGGGAIIASATISGWLAVINFFIIMIGIAGVALGVFLLITGITLLLAALAEKEKKEKKADNK